MRDAILDEIREMGPISAPDIATNLGIPVDAARRVVYRLAAEGVLDSDDYQQRARVCWLAEGDGLPETTR